MKTKVTMWCTHRWLTKGILKLDGTVFGREDYAKGSGLPVYFRSEGHDSQVIGKDAFSELEDAKQRVGELVAAKLRSYEKGREKLMEILEELDGELD